MTRPMAKRLTSTSVDRAKSKKKTYRIHDVDHRGLYLQITPSGSKSWLLRYQIGGVEKFMGLGSARDFTLKEAREKARLFRQQIAEKIDPIAARTAQRDLAIQQVRERLTFRDAVEEFLKVWGPTWKNDKHRAQWRTTLATYGFPKLGDRAVADITTAMVNECVADIWHKTPETARRTSDRIERIVQWVKDGKPLPRTNGNGKKHHAALHWQELPGFMVDLRERDSISARALEFTILTTARTGDTIGATWDEIDCEKRLWVIPAERMKSPREHRVPLSDCALEILKSLQREKGNPYVFIGGKAKTGLSNMAMLNVVRDLRPGMTVHGFRATFKTWADESQHVENAVVEAQMAHISGDKVEMAYRRGDFLAKRAKLVSDWCKYCNSKPATVTRLHAKTA